MNQHEIATLFIKLRIINYDIRDDGAIEIRGGINLSTLLKIYHYYPTITIGSVSGNIYGSGCTETKLLGFPSHVGGLVHLMYSSLEATIENFELLYKCNYLSVVLPRYFEYGYVRYCKMRKRSESIVELLYE